MPHAPKPAWQAARERSAHLAVLKPISANEVRRGDDDIAGFDVTGQLAPGHYSPPGPCVRRLPWDGEGAMSQSIMRPMTPAVIATSARLKMYQ